MADNKFFSSPSVDVIEKSTKIIGNIFSKADFRIDGEVEGINGTVSANRREVAHLGGRKKARHKFSEFQGSGPNHS